MTIRPPREAETIQSAEHEPPSEQSSLQGSDTLVLAVMDVFHAEVTDNRAEVLEDSVRDGTRTLESITDPHVRERVQARIRERPTT